jgi:two-component system, chemotaxis family, sensor kinase CheA
VILANGISQEDLKLFLQEAEEQLQLLDEDIVKLEKESENMTLLQEIFRAAHTIKGSAAMIGHERMSDLAHAMEDVLDRVRKKSMVINAQVVDALLISLDILKTLKKELIDLDCQETDIKPYVEALNAIVRGIPSENKSDYTGKDAGQDKNTEVQLEQALTGGKQAFEITINFKKETQWAAVRCYQVIQELSGRGQIIRSNPSLADIDAGKSDTKICIILAGNSNETDLKESLKNIEDIDNSIFVPYREQEKSEIVNETDNNRTVPDAATKKKEETNNNQTVRINITRLDTLMEQMGELVINRNSASQISKTLGERYPDDEMVQNLSDSLSQVGKIVSTLQQDIMTIRMLPIEIVFNSLPRMVRDLARKMNKNIDFTVDGQDTEIDRSVIEYLRDPLVHLLRNSVDHGIESAEERRAAGKPEVGQIKLCAFQQQDNITITVADDGKGLDAKSIKEAAIRKQLISPEEAAKLSESETIDLIFASGLSTAKKTTEISGRGVGLDIVKTNVQAIGGSVKVSSEIGQGTKFALVLPLTLAIIPALLVTTGKSTCAVPLSSVVEANNIRKSDIKTIRGREVIIFRNKVLPLLRLSQIFDSYADLEKNASYNFVVIRHSDTQIGMIVDSLIGQQEIVVKSLNRFIAKGGGITGASILGDGQVVLILDPGSLVKLMTSESALNNAKVLV